MHYLLLQALKKKPPFSTFAAAMPNLIGGSK